MNKCRWEDKKFVPCTGMKAFFELTGLTKCKDAFESGELFTEESKCPSCNEVLLKPIMWVYNVAAE